VRQARRAAAQPAERGRALLLEPPALRGPHARRRATRRRTPAAAERAARHRPLLDLPRGEPDVREGLTPPGARPVLARCAHSAPPTPPDPAPGAAKPHPALRMPGLLLAPAGEAGTSLKIRCAIDAIDRSEAIFLGPGVFQVAPRHIDVPSRGVVEHDLMRRLAANLFTAEEMLFMLGELGVD